MSKATKRHGRRVHRPAPGCATARTQYPTKQACESATGDDAERCDRCRQWHAKHDRPRSRRNR